MDAKPAPSKVTARRPAGLRLLRPRSRPARAAETNLPPEVLREARRTSNLPTAFQAHIDTLRDEVPISMLARVVEQIHADDGMQQDQVWSNMRSMARSLKLTRELGPAST